MSRLYHRHVGFFPTLADISSGHGSRFLDSMFSRMKVYRRRAHGLTVLELQGEETDIELKVISRLGPRERRTLVRSFFKQIQPWVRHFTFAAIDHSNKGVVTGRRSRERGVPGIEQAPVTSLTGGYGFELRIERGLCFPQRKTREAIEDFLRQCREKPDTPLASDRV